MSQFTIKGIVIKTPTSHLKLTMIQNIFIKIPKQCFSFELMILNVCSNPTLSLIIWEVLACARILSKDHYCLSTDVQTHAVIGIRLTDESKLSPQV